MKIKLHFSEAAAADILEQADWYAEQSDEMLAQRWDSAVTSTVLRIAEFPKSGALCHFSSAELQEIRRVPVDEFPKHLIFYRVERKSVVVLRVIHGARDLDSLL